MALPRHRNRFTRASTPNHRRRTAGGKGRDLARPVPEVPTRIAPKKRRGFAICRLCLCGPPHLGRL